MAAAWERAVRAAEMVVLERAVQAGAAAVITAAAGVTATVREAAVVVMVSTPP